MSAPEEKYSKEYHKVMVNREEKKLIRQALYLSEYEDSFKRLFHCDKIWCRKTQKNENVIIGLCRADGSNLSYHANNRKAKLRLLINNTQYVVFNDSGLNTKASASVNSALIRFSNYLKLDGSILSAYYAKTDSVKITAVNRTNGMTLFSDVIVAVNTSAKATIDSTYWIINSNAQANKGDLIDLTITATNSEGDYSTTYAGIVCEGMMDGYQFWQFLSSQNQNPSLGTQYVVVPTVEQWNFITNTLLVESQYKVGWNATNERDIGTPLHGVQGADFSEGALTNILPAGHYYVISGLDKAVILLVDNQGRAYGWCESTYIPPQPTNPLDSVIVDITANYTNDGVNVIISDMYVTLHNNSSDNMRISVSVKMIDATPNINIGATTIDVNAGATDGDNVLDTASGKDEPIKYSTATGSPTAKVTLTYGAFSRDNIEIELTN